MADGGQLPEVDRAQVDETRVDIACGVGVGVGLGGT